MAASLSQAPELTMNSQSNLQHLSLLSPKASIYCASMVGKQALSDVLERIQSRTDSIQLGYSGYVYTYKIFHISQVVSLSKYFSIAPVLEINYVIG